MERNFLTPSAELQDDSVPCVRCGYDLRGSKGSDRCPECGAPTSRSRLQPLLRFAEPRWIRQLAIGAGIETTALMLVVLLLFATSGPLGNLLVWAATAIWMYGAFALTAREPRAGPAASAVLNWAIRVIVCLPAATSLLSLLRLIPGILVEWVAEATVVTRAILVCALLHRLACRMPSIRLGRQASVLYWSLLCGASIIAAGVMLDLMTGWMQLAHASRKNDWASHAAGAGHLVVAVALIAVVLGLFWYLGLLIAFAVAFGREAGAARRLGTGETR